METDAPDLGTSVDQGYMVKRVFAGGDQSYATLLSPTVSKTLPVVVMFELSIYTMCDHF